MARVRFLNVVIAGLVVAVGVTALLTSGCTIATPFEGPGYDADAGVTLEGVDGPVIVAITQAVLGGGDREGFNEGTRSVMSGMDGHEGLIAWSVRRELVGDNAWTMTVWADDASLNKFVSSSVHRDAVKRGMPAVRQTRFVSFEVDAGELPIGWDEALARLEEAEMEDASRY